jgi:hypothetical protein
MNLFIGKFIDEKYFWPLIGVVLGWTLTMVGSGLKERAERRRRVGTLLAILVLVRNQINTLIKASDEFFEHLEDLESYERDRKGITERHFLEPANQTDALVEAIRDFSGDYPLHSLKLQGMINALLKVKAASFKEASKNPNMYINMITMHELAIKITAKEIGKYVNRLALMHGLSTFIKFRYTEFMINRKNVKNNQFISKFAGDMLKAIREKNPDMNVEQKDSGNS